MPEGCETYRVYDVSTLPQGGILLTWFLRERRGATIGLILAESPGLVHSSMDDICA